MTRECHCSFCEKPKSEVDYLVAGPTALICNECVELCRLIGRIGTGHGDAVSMMQAGLCRDGAASLDLYRRALRQG